MSNRSLASNVNCKAPAGSFFVSSNRIAKNCGAREAGISTVTLAVPNDSVSFSSSSKRNDYKSLESFSTEIKNSVVEFWKICWFAMIYLSHDRCLSRKGRFRLEPTDAETSVRLASLYQKAM